MDLPNWWRQLLARYWWIAVLVATVLTLAAIDGALDFLREDLLPMALAMASSLSVGEWASLAVIILSLTLLAGILYLTRRVLTLHAAPSGLSEGEESGGKTSKLVETYRDQAERYQRMYEEEEQRFWTSKDLQWESEELSPHRKGERYGVRVSVRSMTPIHSPIRLRFWFSDEVQDPRVEFLPDSEDPSPQPSSRIVLRDEAETHQGGRVDVKWVGASSLLRGHGDVLSGASSFRLTVYAVEPETSIETRSVERRYKLS